MGERERSAGIRLAGNLEAPATFAQAAGGGVEILSLKGGMRSNNPESEEI